MVLGLKEIPLDKIESICHKYRIQELSAFGSAIRDDFHEGSDIDLLVEFRPNHGLGMIEFLQCRDELAQALGRRVDLVQKSGLKRFLRDHILASSRVLYAN